MTPEAIEIVDTAVKIGLGALITGLSTYLLAKSKYSHEDKHNAKERRVKLLETIALNIEDSKFKLEESCHPFWLQVVEKDYSNNQDNIKMSINYLLEARSILGQAKALSLLLGEAVLGDLLLQCDDKIEKTYFLMSEKGIENQHKKMNSIHKKIYKLFHQCYSQLEMAYDNA